MNGLLCFDGCGDDPAVVSAACLRRGEGKRGGGEGADARAGCCGVL